MPHELSPEDLSACLDRALAPERQRAAESHVAACPDCRRELESLKQASARFKALGGAKAPAGLKAQLAQAARKTPPRTGPSAGVYVLWLGGLVLVLFGAGKVLRPQISAVFNQIMGMVSGAAQGVSSGR